MTQTYLTRFITAQDPVYNGVLSELKSGQKRSHWMWFFFPQIYGLGHGPIAMRYAIQSTHEARAYLSHPVLGKRLLECAETVKAIQDRSASQILDDPVCFYRWWGVSLPRFDHEVIRGQPDERTLEILKAQEVNEHLQS